MKFRFLVDGVPANTYTVDVTDGRLSTRFRMTDKKTGREFIVYDKTQAGARLKFLPMLDTVPELGDIDIQEAGYIDAEGQLVLSADESQEIQISLVEGNIPSRKRA